MIFQLAEHVQCFLSEHNIPPPKSFHEEMLKNQQRQQEKLAQEQQQRIDQQRKREEQMVRVSMEHCQDFRILLLAVVWKLEHCTLVLNAYFLDPFNIAKHINLLLQNGLYINKSLTGCNTYFLVPTW